MLEKDKMLLHFDAPVLKDRGDILFYCYPSVRPSVCLLKLNVKT